MEVYVLVEEKILTQHPQGKSGVSISLEKYQSIRQAIIVSLIDGEEMTFEKLRNEVQRQLEGKFDGSISWYYTTVKLDLEARGEIVRVGKGSPQRIRLGKLD